MTYVANAGNDAAIQQNVENAVAAIYGLNKDDSRLADRVKAVQDNAKDDADKTASDSSASTKAKKYTTVPTWLTT
ncbi:MAG: hypothetical protein LUE99_00850 [Bacteroides sp.]|nr:hypothetical protein [Bacteroides sp.]